MTVDFSITHHTTTKTVGVQPLIDLHRLLWGGRLVVVGAARLLKFVMSVCSDVTQMLVSSCHIIIIQTIDTSLATPLPAIKRSLITVITRSLPDSCCTGWPLSQQHPYDSSKRVSLI